MSTGRYLRPADFGRLCGIVAKKPGVKITMGIRRGHLVANNEGLLDIRHPKNKSYIAKLKAQNAAKQNGQAKPTPKQTPKATAKPKEIPKKSPKKEPIKKKQVEIDEKQDEQELTPEFTFSFNPDGSVDVNSLKAYSLTDIKAIEDIRLKQLNIRLKAIEESKYLGKMIDSDLASESLLVFAKTFMQFMGDHLNTWIMDFTHRNKLPNEELARLTGEAKRYVNKAYDDALYSAEEKMEQAKKDTVKTAIQNLEDE